jgi:uncharacterized protein YdeI (YjbR/CyaY-like superfamily)
MPERLPHAMPADLRRALETMPESSAAWKTLTPLARNEWNCFVTSPKKPETRVLRIECTVSDLAQGKRRPCCWPGCADRQDTARAD